MTAAADSDEVYTSLVDAESGEVLRSDNKVEEVSGLAWDYYPGAASGGTQVSRNFTALGLAFGEARTTLNGTNAHVFSDWNDNDAPDSSGGGGVGGNEETDPTLAGLQVFNDFTHAAGLCAPTYTSTCSWDSTDNGPFPTPPGWYQNRRQNAVQVFYFVNQFHDHLQDDPDIAWTTRNFEGGDKVVAHAGDGADTGVSGQFLGLHMPDVDHVNNANMFTPPDGQSPIMQMYLFTSFTGNINTDPTPDGNGGDDAAVVYHEYTHGLSNRLITYADGRGALDSFQSGAMGEAWSDWYAMDFLVDEGFAPNTGAVGDVKLDRYLGNNRPTLRTEGLDCPVAPATSACPGGDDTGSQGGYTLGDMGRVWSGGPEVHADGEIWAQTLWDLRQAVGVGDTRFLVTEAMRLSPRNPSFLDMRNAILQANQVGILDGRADHEATIWQVFAGRGMGFFAATEDADDTVPIESFVLPPDPARRRRLPRGRGHGRGHGTAARRRPSVYFAGLGFADTTDALGQYVITDVPVGNLPPGGCVEGRVRPRHRPKRRHCRRHGDRRRLRRPAGLGRVRRRWSHPLVHGAELHRVRLRAGARDRPVRGNGLVHRQAEPRTDGSTIDHGEAARLRGRQLVRRRSGSGLRRSGQRVGPGIQDRDVEDRGQRLVDEREDRTFTLGQAHQLNAVPISLRKAVRYVRFTITSNHGDAQYMDLAELVVYGTPTPTCLGRAATKVGTNAAEHDQRRLGRRRDRGSWRATTRSTARAARTSSAAATGNDRLTGGSGVDKFDGGDGNDTLFARDGARRPPSRVAPAPIASRKDKSDKTNSVEKRLLALDGPEPRRLSPSCPNRAAGRRSRAAARRLGRRPGGGRRPR